MSNKYCKDENYLFSIERYGKNEMKDLMHPKTKWEQICTDIEIKIIKGILKSTDKLPSISELSEEYNVSKSTAQKTLENLCDFNIISKRRGVGYFVLPYSIEKLKRKHLKILEDKGIEFLEYAKRLNFNEKEILCYFQTLLSLD